MDHSETEMPMPELLNSGAGIASVVIGLITLFLSVVVYSGWSGAMSFAVSRQMMNATGTSFSAFSAMMQYTFLVQLAVKAVASVIGTVAAIVGLLQSERRKDIAYVGLALNGILLLSAFVNMGTHYALPVLRF
jgi:heme exporter protein D